MNINGIEQVAPLTQENNLSQSLSESLAPKEIKSNFSEWLSSELSETNKQIHEAHYNLRQLAMGEADSLHHVMLSLEKAKKSFELVVQVRNKLLEGYQELLRMQV